MTPEETSNWQAAIAGAIDLRLINILITVAKDQKNRDAAVMVAVKAKAMGFVANKLTGQYEAPKPPMQMHRTRGHNLLYVGWDNGNLHCTFPQGRYIYKNVPEAEYDKLKHSVYPDRLFSTNIKGKFESEKTA